MRLNVETLSGIQSFYQIGIGVDWIDRREYGWWVVSVKHLFKAIGNAKTFFRISNTS